MVPVISKYKVLPALTPSRSHVFPSQTPHTLTTILRRPRFFLFDFFLLFFSSVKPTRKISFKFTLAFDNLWMRLEGKLEDR